MKARADPLAQATNILFSFAGAAGAGLKKTFNLESKNYKYWQNVFKDLGPEFANELNLVSQLLTEASRAASHAEKAQILSKVVPKIVSVGKAITMFAAEHYPPIVGQIYDRVNEVLFSKIDEGVEAAAELWRTLVAEAEESSKPIVYNVSDLQAAPGNMPGTVILTWSVPEFLGTGRSDFPNPIGFIVKWIRGDQRQGVYAWEEEIKPGFVITPRIDLKPGQPISVRIDGLDSATPYQFAVFAFDGYIGSMSGMSNIAVTQTP